MRQAVKCEFWIRTGGRAGHRESFDKSYIGCGRHPLSDLRFDPDRDLDVSSRHAAVLHAGDRYVLRDLGSRNGTFVGGRKIESDYELSDGDVVRFGLMGPEVEFRLVQEGAEQVMSAVHAPAAPSAPPAASARPGTAAGGRTGAGRTARPPSTAAAPSATGVLRAQVTAQAARFRALLVVLGIVLVGAVAVVIWQGRTAHRQVATLGSALDSLSREVRALRIAQARADSEADALRRRIADTRDAGQRTVLQQSLAAVQQRQRGIAAAQTVDWVAINRANAGAVAMIYVKFPSDSVFTGTGFCVAASGLLLTNRHVVLDRNGARPTQIAVQFSGSSEVYRARIERLSPDADVATVRITDPGTFPVVQGLAGTAGNGGPEVGDPIALIGYPLGTDAPMGATGQTPTVNSTLAPGTIGKILPDSLLQLDAFSATGASGSPIFDRRGQVIGVEFGGLRDTNGRIVLGLPIRRALALLPS